MADREKQLAITLKGKADTSSAFSSFRNDLDQAERAGKAAAANISSAWEESVTKIRNVAAVGFAAVAGSIGFASKEAMAGEDSLNRVKAAVRVAGGDFSAFEGKVNATASSLQAMTRYSDEQLLDTLARMIQRTGDYEGSLNRLSLVTDIAAAFQIDVAQAGDMVSAAMQGELGMLSRLLPSLADEVKALGETATAGERAATILDRLAGYTGTAGEDAKTASGSVDRLKNTFSDTAEKIGAAFLPALEQASEKLIKIAEAAGKVVENNEDTVATIGLFGLTVTGAIAGAAQFGKTVYDIGHAVTFLKTAVTALSASPWTVVVSGIVAVGGVLWELSDSMTATGKAEQDLNAIMNETGASYDQLRSKQDEIFGKFADYKSGTDEQRQAWDEYVDALRAAVPFMGPMPAAIENIGNAHKKAAADTKLNADAIRDLMNAGLDFEAAKELSRVTGGSVFPTEVKPVEPAFIGPIEDPVAIAKYNWDSEQRKKADEEKRELLEKEKQAFLSHTQFLQSTYAFAVQSMINTDMTGKQRREAIWNTFKSNAISYIAQITGKHIFDELAKSAATIKGLAASGAANAAATAADRASAKIVQTGWMQAAYAKFLAFYAFTGPAAPALAGAQVAQGLAAMQAINVAGFQHGGIVPGSGFGDRVPAMLEPGEGIVKRSAMQSNPGVVQALNSGKNVGGGNTIINNINVDGEGLTIQRKIEIRDFVESIMAPMFERLLDDRRFSASYAR